MKVVGVIPARWGSTRLPGKILMPICGKPLVQWVVENVRKAKNLDSLMVATDDQRIYDLIEGLGEKAVMTSPDHPSGTDRIAEAVKDMDIDVVVNIQGDEPMIDPDLIDKLAEAMKSDKTLDMATAAVPMKNSEELGKSSVVKVVFDQNGLAMYFSRSLIPNVRDENDAISGEKVLHWRHLGIYAYSMTFLGRLVKEPQCDLEKLEKLEQLRALYIGGRIMVVKTEDTGIGVDTIEDVKYIESVLRDRKQ